MNQLLEVSITALSVWRLAHMIKSESGPWDLITRFRVRMWDNVIGRAMDCGACLSVWFSLIWFAPLIIRTLLAVSALAMMLEGLYVMLRREE